MSISHLTEGEIRVASRDEFMTSEFFGEALLLGRRETLGTQIASAQNNFYATMADYGPFILNLILISHFTQLTATNLILISHFTQLTATLTSDSEFLILNCTQD